VCVLLCKGGGVVVCDDMSERIDHSLVGRIQSS